MTGVDIRREASGAVSDLGVFVPIAVALILVNGLSATAVLLPAAVLYVASGLYYRVPVPVQPLKAFGAIAIAQGLGPDVVAAGAIVMGLIFVPLGASGVLDRVSSWVPLPVVRGVQLSVGLIFVKLAWGMVSRPPAVAVGWQDPVWLPVVAAVAALVAIAGRRWGSSLWLIVVGMGVAVWDFVTTHAPSAEGSPWGPTPVSVGLPPLRSFGVAVVALVLPQLPLTFANSCVATANVAERYFGRRAGRVRPGRLALSLGLTNLGVGLISGMPVCHGAGGMTAHRKFGATTGYATAGLGVVLLALALVFGRSVGLGLAGFPVWVLAGLLTASGVLHMMLLADLRGPRAWVFALVIGALGAFGQLAVAMLVGWGLWWALGRVRPLRSSDDSVR